MPGASLFVSLGVGLARLDFLDGGGAASSSLGCRCLGGRLAGGLALALLCRLLCCLEGVGLAPTPTCDGAPVLDVRAEGETHVLRVLVVEVNLVLIAVECERHRLVRLAAVQIIHEDDVYLLSHVNGPPFLAVYPS